jgi:hypothetical protein
MSKGQRGNKEAKKPKKVREPVKPPGLGAALPATAHDASLARRKPR